MNAEFASKDYTVGQLNAMVKKIVDQVGRNGPNLLLQDRLEIKLIKDTILNWIGVTKPLATSHRFVAKDKFVKNSKEVKLNYFYGSFEDDFLYGNGKIEEPLSGQSLQYGELTKDSVDAPIIEELGGEAKAETTLTELYDLLKKQGNGEKGDLLTNGYANIFYIKNKNGVLRTVGVDWVGGGWRVDAGSVGFPSGWGAGRRVFSRDS